MTCTPSAFPIAARAEATAIAPQRNQASDGICQGPSNTPGDHIADARGIPHAVDITQDARPGVGFDAHWFGNRLAEEWVAGNKIIRDLLKYFVSHDYASGQAKIFDPDVGRPWWRIMSGDSHISHLHMSFKYTTWAENYTGDLWGLVNNIHVPVVDEEMDMVIAPNKPDVNGRVPYALLDRVRKVIMLFNNAAIAGDQAVGGHREIRVVTNSIVGGMTATRNPASKLPDNKGVEVGCLDGATYKYYWS